MQIKITMERGALYRDGVARQGGIDVNVVLEMADDTLPTQQIELIKTATGAAMRCWEKATEAQREEAKATPPKCPRCGGSGITLDAQYQEARCGECLGGGRAR